MLAALQSTVLLLGLFACAVGVSAAVMRLQLRGWNEVQLAVVGLLLYALWKGGTSPEGGFSLREAWRSFHSLPLWKQLYLANISLSMLADVLKLVAMLLSAGDGPGSFGARRRR